MISVRILDISYYMSYPIANLDVKYSEFRGVEVRQVPVIQIYGTSQTGHKTCLNVHDVFPYVYIPYDGSEPAGNLSYKIATELDKALNISLGQAASNTVHIHNIVLVSGIPFYGYHERKHQFFKIYFYNPALIKKACSLLENGAILGKTFQPFESHIPYILQFMIDFNLHGMSFVNISLAMFRSNPDYPELLDNIPPHLILPNGIQRRSVCKLELDVLASNIKNKDEIASGKLTSNPGIAALWEDEKQRRRNKEMDSQISFSLTQERDNIRPTASHLFFEEKLTDKLSREFTSDESTLDKSVYPAETPEDGELLNASAADYTILDSTSLDETIKETQTKEYDENDAKLLAVLQNLKETAGIEEDSILSQQVEEPENESSDNEEDHNLSLLNKDVNVPDDDNIWENSFWDEFEEISNQIPQIDGQFDIDSSYLHQKNLNIIDYLPMVYNGQHNKNEYRHASEVYIYSDLNVPENMKLNPGMNKLILSKRRPERSLSSVTILSDVCIKCAENSGCSLRTNKTSESDYETLYILDDNCNFTYEKEQLNSEVVINDVILISDEESSVTPVLSPKLDDNVTEILPIFDTNYETQQIEEEVLISEFASISTETDNTCKEETDTISNTKGETSNIENDKITEHDIKTDNCLSTTDIKNVSVIPKRKRGRPPKKRNEVKSNIENEKILEQNIKSEDPLTKSDFKNESKILEHDIKSEKSLSICDLSTIQSNIKREELKPNIEKTNLYNLRSTSSHKGVKLACKFCGNCDISPKYRTKYKSDIHVKVPSKAYHISMSDIRSQNFIRKLRKMSPERDKILNEIEVNNVSKVEVIISIKEEIFSEHEILQSEHLNCKFNFISEEHEQMNNDELKIEEDRPSMKFSSKNETSTSLSLPTTEYPNCPSNEDINDLIDNLQKILEEHGNGENTKCNAIDYLPKVEEILETEIFAPSNSSNESSASNSLETPTKIDYFEKNMLRNPEESEIVKRIDPFVENSNTAMLQIYVENEISRMTKISNNEAIGLEAPSVLDENEAEVNKTALTSNKNHLLNNDNQNYNQIQKCENVVELKNISLNEDKNGSLDLNITNQVVETIKLAPTKNSEVETEYNYNKNEKEYKVHISCYTIEEFEQLKNQLSILNLYGLSDSPSSSSTSDEEISLKFKKNSEDLKLSNLDGQADSQSNSASSNGPSKKKQLKSQKKLTKKKSSCRLPGLSKKLVKKARKNKKTSVIKNSHEKKDVITTESTENSSLTENRTSENTEEELDKNDNKKKITKSSKHKKVKKSNNILKQSQNQNNPSKIAENGITVPKVNNITHEINKRELQVVLVPLQLHLKTDTTNISTDSLDIEQPDKKVKTDLKTDTNVKQKIRGRRFNSNSFTNISTVSLDIEQPDKKMKADLKTDTNVKQKIRGRRCNSYSFTNISTDSLDIKQPDKKMKTDFGNLASSEKTISPSSLNSSEKLKESSNVPMSLNRSITKHMVLCSSSSSDETTTIESKKVKPARRRNIRRNRLSTKKILNSSKMVDDPQAEISSTSQNVIDSSEQSEMIKTRDISSVKLSEKLKSNKTNEGITCKNSVNIQQQPTKKVELRKRTILTEKKPSESAISVKNTEKNILDDDCVEICPVLKSTEKNVLDEDSDEIFPVLKPTSSDLCKNAVVVLEQLSLERIKKMTISKEKKQYKTPVNELRPQSKERIRKIKSENTSPIRNKKKVISPKYSPLNVIIRSPKKHANLTNSEYEPDIKKLKNNSTDAELNKNADKAVTRSRYHLSQGTGELQFIPLLKDPKNITTDKTISANFKLLSEEIKSPDTVKKNLFNTKTEHSNITLVEEFKTCEYKKSSKDFQKDIDFVRELKEKEELFVKELESNCGIKRNSENNKTVNFDLSINNISPSNKTNNDSNCKNNETLLITKNDNVKSKYFQDVKESQQEPISNKSTPKPVRRIVKKKDKKPISLTKLHNLDYCNITPEKNLSFNVTNFYSPRETLSQQNEKILCDIDHYNTKTHNLTAAELYDLRRDFAPQPGTSRIDEEFEYYSSNFSFSYNDISLMDSTFILNTPNSQQINQNTSVLDLTVTGDTNNNSKIWMPKYFPPSRSDIKNSLALYNIPENRFQEPFYSDYSDVTGKVDIGHNVLKISSTTARDLEYFESCTGFIGIEKWRKDKFKEFYSQEYLENIKVTLASHKKIILTPVNLPPHRKEIMSWIHMKNNESSEKLVEKIEKPRIIIPQSPCNDSFNDSMSLSPCTPASLTGSSNVIESSQDSTPVSSKCSSPNIARRGKSKKRGTLQRKVLFSQSKQKAQEEPKLLNITENHSANDSCQITGVTLDNTHGFQMSYENLQDAKALSEHLYLTILVVEVHICTRGDFFPDPQYDSVRAIFYSIWNDVPENSSLPSKETGVIVVDTLPGTPTKQTTSILEGTGANCQIIYVKSEFELIDEFIKLIRKWDPDIFVGYEIEMLSWGYLIDRCSVIGINLSVQISRTNPAIIKNKTGENKQEELRLNGRIILDAWRLFRHEIALQSYTFENLMYHILHQRVPAHSFRNLSFWWEYRSNYFRYITVNYYITRVEGILQLLDQLDLIGRTSELAKLFGIQFFEVLSRGSQFRVESMMLRLAKPLNYIPISPSVQQRAKMRAPESLPLILEPESRFYVDPVIVLDFQSLYPSIIIAYNYCFSTCIGRVEKLGTNSPFDFGACQLKISRSRVQKLHNKINFSPCGVGFVKPEVRQGILPRMLKEILETRLMVKSSMKENKENKLLQRVLHNRQLGLKLIANVTYGYTSANFSGRMPCIEVGDSVVSKGRETLERAIHLIETTEKWRARVVYGDTDSLFVLVSGRSREDAFKIGAEIAEAVTNDNPPPVKLKLEKVYQPCILQTKKRYVGYMYESPDQKEPEYNAKGIETVRRDGCPAVAKMLEKTLRLLFETRDVSLVKRYVVRQFEKLITGRASIQDLIFAREFRGFGGYRPGACVPALELAKKWIAVDKRREPRRSERVPYIVVNGPPGLPLIRLVKCPRELLNQEQGMSLRPNAVYYITKVIAPPLNRCLGLIGANVLAWYNDMPRKQLQILPTDIHFERSKKSTISQYFVTMSCIVCNNQTRDGLCDDCINNPQQTVVVLQEKLRQWERSFDDIKQVCGSCCGRVEYTDCTSLDCPVLYRLSQSKRDLKQVPFVRNLLSKFL